MAILLVIPLFFGYLITHRLLGRDTLPAVLGESLALALITTIFLTSVVIHALPLQGLFGYSSLELSLTLGLFLQIIFGVVIFTRCPSPTLIAPSFQVKASLFSLLAILGVNLTSKIHSHFTTTSWLNIPIQGLLRYGHVNPPHPYLPQATLQGSFGADRGLAIISQLVGCDVIFGQHLLSGIILLASCLILFHTFSTSSGSVITGILGTVAISLGLPISPASVVAQPLLGQGGLLYLCFTLALSLSLKLWSEPQLTSILTLAIVGATYASFSEPQFLVFIGAVTLAASVATVRRLILPKAFVSTLVAIGLAIPLAWVLAAPLPKISSITTLSLSLQPSLPIIDFPTVVFPVTAFILWRRRDLAGLIMMALGSLGFVAFIFFKPATPFAQLSFSLQALTAMGLASCLGLALGPNKRQVINTSFQGPPTTNSPSKSDPPLTEDGAASTGLRPTDVLKFTLMVWLCWPGLSLFVHQLKYLRDHSLASWWPVPTTKLWLQRHPEFDFQPIDLRAATWLSRQANPSDRILTNHIAENNASLLYEAMFIGISGVASVGHAAPGPNRQIELVPFRKLPAAIEFWRTRRPELLSLLSAKWLLYRNDEGIEPPSFPGTELIHREEDGPHLRLLYQVNPSKLPVIPTTTTSPTLPRATARFLPAPTVIRGGHQTTLTLLSASSKPTQGLLKVRFGSSTSPGPLPQDLYFQAKILPSKPFPITVIAPIQEGPSTLTATWYPDPGQPGLVVTPLTLEVNFKTLLRQVKLLQLIPPYGQTPSLLIWPSNQHLKVRLHFTMPKGVQRLSSLLLGVAFTPAEKHTEPPLSWNQVQSIDLTPNPIDISLITPSKPGSYHLTFYLSAEHGHLLSLPAGDITITITDSAPIDPITQSFPAPSLQTVIR